MRRPSWRDGAVAAGPVLAIPVSGWLSCMLLGVCTPDRILLYQWPSWLACYLPYWTLLYFFRRQFLPESRVERPGEGHPLVAAGLKVVNAVSAGTAVRFAVAAAVVLFWKDEEVYKPIYVFLLHMGSFFLFQLVCVSAIKK